MHLRASTPVGDDASVEAARLHLDVQPAAQSGEPALTFTLRADGDDAAIGVSASARVRISPIWRWTAR